MQYFLFQRNPGGWISYYQPDLSSTAEDTSMVPICQHPHPKLFNSRSFKKNTHSAGWFASWSTLPLFPCHMVMSPWTHSSSNTWSKWPSLGSTYLEAQNHPLGLFGLALLFEDTMESKFRWLIIWNTVRIFNFKGVSQDFQGAWRSGAFFFPSDQMRIWSRTISCWTAKGKMSIEVFTTASGLSSTWAPSATRPFAQPTPPWSLAPWLLVGPRSCTKWLQMCYLGWGPCLRIHRGSISLNVVLSWWG